MDEAVNFSATSDLRESLSDQVRPLLEWYEHHAKPFLSAEAPETLPAIENDADRLRRILKRPEHVTVCFLGHSGIGKSTL